MWYADVPPWLIFAHTPISAPTVTSLPTPITAVPIMPQKPRARASGVAPMPLPKTTPAHATEKGRPPQGWLQASGFPSGVLATDNQWHPTKWVGGGKATLYQAVKTITGLPVSLGVGVAGNSKVHWPMQSRLTCLYSVARQAGVIIEIMPHTVRIISG